MTVSEPTADEWTMILRGLVADMIRVSGIAIRSGADRDEIARIIDVARISR